MSSLGNCAVALGTLLLSMSAIFAQNNTLAIINFAVQKPLTKAQSNFVVDGLKQKFNLTGKYIILDSWLVDTILSGLEYTGKKECETPECLGTIGRKLTVNKIIGGSIIKKGTVVLLSATVLDVSLNKIVATGLVEIPAGKKSITGQDVTQLFDHLNTDLPAKGDSLQGTTHEQVTIRKKVWYVIPLSLCVVGIGAAAIYFSSKTTSNEITADTGISLGNRPVR